MNTEEQGGLESLRRDIDAIDDAIHDLIMRRAEVANAIREAKRDHRIKLRPAREAAILYRLMVRHRGSFPRRELARIWRELIVATLSIEERFSVAVHVPDGEVGYCALARDHYGSFTPMSTHGSGQGVITAVRAREATLGILPLPQKDDAAPWWRHLVTDTADAPRIVARLPFFGGGNGAAGLSALVICPLPHEPSGRDVSCLVIECGKEIGSRRLEHTIGDVSLSVRSVFTCQDEHDPNIWLHLIEVQGFVHRRDRRLKRIVEALDAPSKRLLHLGGYALPLGASELDLPAGADADGT